MYFRQLHLGNFGGLGWVRLGCNEDRFLFWCLVVVRFVGAPDQKLQIQLLLIDL